MTYGALIWGLMCNKSSFNRVFVLQKKAIRIIDNAKYNASTKPLFKKWKILCLDDLVKLENAKLMYKYVQNMLPKPLHNLFEKNNKYHAYNTRRGQFPMIVKHSTALFNKSFLCQGPSIWDKIHNDIKTCKKIHQFIKMYKKSCF